MGQITWLLLFVASLAGAQEKQEPPRLFFELRGGSKVSGFTDTSTLPVRTSYARMDVKIRIIDSIEFSDEQPNASLTLRNGDRLKGELALERLTIDAAFGEAGIAVDQIRHMAVVPAGGAPGLLLWNRLDGHRSLVGPDVEFLDRDEYVRGKSGRAVQVSGHHTWGFRVPAGIVKGAKQGTIEYWMKVVKKQPTVSHGSGPIYDLVYPGVHAQYNANDGNGHGKYSIQSERYFV